MDARERLRRYLEQRRDLGERELVLDSLSVDEVLGLVGARPRAGDAAAPARPAETAVPLAREPEPDDVVAPADHPRLRGEGEPGVQELPPRPAVQPENAERGGLAREVRLEGAETGDWRAALRAAGAAPDATAETDPMPAKRASRAATTPRNAFPLPDDGGQPGDGMDPSTAPGAGAVADAGRGDRAAAQGAKRHSARHRHPDRADRRGVRGPARRPVRSPRGSRRDRALGAPVHALPALPDRDARRAWRGQPGRGLRRRRRGPGRGRGRQRRAVRGRRRDSCSRRSSPRSTWLARTSSSATSSSTVRRATGIPPPDEVEACSPYLVRQTRAGAPEGHPRAGELRGADAPRTRSSASGSCAGRSTATTGCRSSSTYHPAALLRNPAWKRPTWEDVQLARRILDRARRRGLTRTATAALRTPRTPSRRCSARCCIDQDAVMRAAEHVDDTMFYREGHRRIFRGDDVDHGARRASSIRSRSPTSSRAAGELEASGGKDYIGFLVDAVPTAANVEYHAKIVREKALLRRLIEVSTEIVAEAFDGGADRRRAARRGRAEDLPGRRSSRTPAGFSRIKELLWPTMERIEAHPARRRRGHRRRRAASRDLDEMTSGFQPADLIIVAARPSMGKTAFTLNIAQHAAIDEAEGRRVLLARDEQGVARAAHAHVRGAHRRADAAQGTCCATTTSRASRAPRAS